MLKDTVVTIRDRFKQIKNNAGGDAPLYVIGDNLKLFDEQYGFFTWDDGNEILWVTRRPENWIYGFRGTKCNLETIALAYDQIQYIGVMYTTEKLIDTMKAAMSYTDDQIKEIIKQLDPTPDQYLNSIRTKEQLEYLKKEQDSEIDAFYVFDHNVKATKVYNGTK